MADLSPLRKVLQFVFDRRSAQQTEAEAKRSLGRVDDGLNRLKATALKLGAALGIALGVRALLNWGRESARMAREAELAWTRLQGAVDNAGESFREREQELRALAAAFQEATIYNDDAFATGLGRMISISGDVGASIANMGLAANVAAQFFDGQLEPAIDLVAKVSTGYTRQLKALGMEADSAQEGLDLLAERSMGAASREARTQTGVLKALSETYGNFREAVGTAISGGEETASVLDVVRGVIIALTGWVERNAESIGTWVKGAIWVATTAVWALYSGIAGLGDLLGGAFAFAVGTVARGLSMLATGFGLVAEGGGKAAKFLGLEGAGEKLEEFGRRVRALAADVDRYASSLQEVGLESLGSAFSRPLLPSIPKPGPRPELPRPRPRASRNQIGNDEEEAAGTDKLTEAEKALAKAREEAARITEAARTPMEVYSDTVNMLAEHLNAGRITQETFNRAVLKAGEEFERATSTPIDEALARHAEGLRSNATIAALLGDEYSALEAEERLLLGTMQALADAGVGALDDRMLSLTDRLAEVQEGLQRTAQEAEITAAIADAAGSVIGAAFGGEIPQMAAAKAKQNAILAAEQLADAAAAAAGLFTGVNVPKHLAAAKMYGAVSAAWGGFAAVTGGFSGGGGGPSAAPRDVGGRQSERAQQAGMEINIEFVGPGFDITNPEVQRVTYGAVEEWKRNGGPNAVVRYRRRRS
jgi:hypothetical protein